MLNAKDAAAQTAANQVKTTNMPELTIIENRISGAASAGLSKVCVGFEGNVIDKDCAELIKQQLIDEGYQVRLVRIANKAIWEFHINW